VVLGQVKAEGGYKDRVKRLCGTQEEKKRSLRGYVSAEERWKSLGGKKRNRSSIRRRFGKRQTREGLTPKRYGFASRIENLKGEKNSLPGS